VTSQQEADCALAIWQAHRDDQVRMDQILREFFAQVRADEYETQLSAVREEMSCVISTLPSSLRSSAVLSSEY